MLYGGECVSPVLFWLNDTAPLKCKVFLYCDDTADFRGKYMKFLEHELGAEEVTCCFSI